MQIKAADDKQSQIDALNALLARSDLPAGTRGKIEQEIRSILSGAKGEKDAAYEIEFHAGDNPHVMTIHDLRLECEGRVAQIDHLIINRLLDIWVCESKSFAEGVAINQYGEWSVYYRGKLQGIPSPIEQNKRHIAVLAAVFKTGRVTLPKRLGFTLQPSIRSVVVVSNKARISRPMGRTRAPLEGLDRVMKVEQLIPSIQKTLDQKRIEDFVTVVGQGTLEKLARQLASLHAPHEVEWAARFGLSSRSLIATAVIPLGPPQAAAASQTTSSMPNRPDASWPGCASCGSRVSPAEVRYCRINSTRFGGRVLCFNCQKTFKRTDS
jgi:hypothetical protein